MRSVITSCVFLTLLFPAWAFGQSVNGLDENGKKHGAWRKMDANGKPVYEGTFHHDEPTGPFTYYHPNGKIKAQSFFWNHGTQCRSTLFAENGTKEAQGLYLNKEKDSVWVFFDADGKLIARESYKAGKKHGQNITYNPISGKPTEERSFRDGKKHGPWITYFDSGKPRITGLYRNGELDSAFRVQFPSGSPQLEGFYKNATKDGNWISYHETGKIKTVETFKEGKAIGLKHYNGTFATHYPSGLPKEEVTYKDEKKSGLSVLYYDTGKLVSKTRPSSDGSGQEAYEEIEGQVVQQKGTYLEDHWVGEVFYYKPNGQLLRKERYDAAGNLLEK